jgi:hypothetical protein
MEAHGQIWAVASLARVGFSYAGLNGVPSCANDFLLNQVIRSPLGFNRPDVVVGFRSPPLFSDPVGSHPPSPLPPYRSTVLAAEPHSSVLH